MLRHREDAIPSSFYRRHTFLELSHAAPSRHQEEGDLSGSKDIYDATSRNLEKSFCHLANKRASRLRGEVLVD